MRILVLTTSAWSDQNASGNTFSNWFSGEEWRNDCFSNLYLRNSMPDNKICTDYYRITPYALLRNFCRSSRVGIHMQIERVQQLSAQSKEANQPEKELIELFHKKPLQIVYAVMEGLYRCRGWDNQKIKEYLIEMNPDIVFASFNNNGMWKPLFKCIRRYTNAKVIMYASDDTFGAAQRTAWYRCRHLVPEHIWCVKNADKLYGASQQICDAYSKLFDCPMTPLYKGAAFDFPVKKTINFPMRIVYAGNLYYGRAESLAAIAHALERINRERFKAQLEIYTNAVVTSELNSKLNRGQHSRIMRARPYEEIKQILHDADMVLHVESFEQKQIDYVRYSFSTKIIDCLQSGSVAMGIGPKGIASIEYMRSIPGAIVVDEIENIEGTINELVEADEQDILNKAKRIREFATMNHDLKEVQARLHRDFEEQINNESGSDK